MDRLNDGNVTAEPGFPKGHPGYAKGFPREKQGYDDHYAHLGPRDQGRTPKWMVPWAHLGTGRIKKFLGGLAVKLSYFLNYFSEEMNAHYVPL